MSITIKQGLSGKYFSRNIPDLIVALTGYRLGVKISVDGKEIFSEYLFPMDTVVTMSDLGDLLTPYVKGALVSAVAVTLTEEDTDGKQLSTESLSFEAVYCEADIPTSCDDFCQKHFLTLLMGVKTTSMGRLEYLHYTGTDDATVMAMYTDGTTKEFTATKIGGTSKYTTIDVSPGDYKQDGKELVSYTVTAGNRRQEYELDLESPDCAPILLFANSFGCEELMYCTGTLTKSPSFKRETTFIEGRNKNYSITETRSFKADTGILSEEMADWFGEVLRSSYIRIVTFRDDKPQIGREVIITESKSDQTNDPDELPRFTFTYQPAGKNHNVVDLQREGRIFDDTFDYTFN